MAKNTICHVEIDVTNLENSQRFFESLFDWTFKSFTEEMVVFGIGEQHLGGLMKVDTVVAGNSPSIWVEVESIDESLSHALSLGATLLAEKSEVPHVGLSAMIGDLDGNHIGLVEFAQ